MEGLIFNIQRFSIHDGPGIRTTVFLKGCNLRCFWCHNPESLICTPQIQVFPKKCIGCGKCLEVCPVHAHRMEDNRKVYLRELCKECGACADICYAGALVLTGKKMTANEVADEVEKDRSFYENSGGGVTFSGGEPLLQNDFLKEALIKCKSKGFHTAVDTAGNVQWEKFEDIIPFTDLFLYDMKVADAAKHKKAAGASNLQIIENLRRLILRNVKVWIRIPVIPGLNDNAEEMAAIADIIIGLPGALKAELLPFHRLGTGKYESLNMEYKAKDFEAVSGEKMEEFAEVFHAKGVEVERR